MKLLLDMNLSPSWVRTLAGIATEVRHWSELGAPNAIGAQVMQAIALMRDDLARGALVTVYPERLRVRVLPLREAQ